MAELIAELRGDPGFGAEDAISPFFPSWVVPLRREGLGRPVFDFPSSHNQPLALAQDAHIAALVGSHHPFWGFYQEHPHLEQIRQGGVPALAAAYIAQMQTIQGRGPYLLFANCGGGYLAWDVARQLLAAGQDIAGIMFYEVPLRADFDALLPGQTPAQTPAEWRLSRDYRPQPLQVDLTFLMTEHWHDRGWWKPWQRVVVGRFQPIVMHLGDARDPDFTERRAESIADHVRDWIERAEALASDR